MPGPAPLDERLRAQMFLRKMLDDALVDATRDVEGSVEPIIEGRSHALTRRLCAAIERQGYALRSHTWGTKRVDGIRRRMELQDFVDTIVMASSPHLFGIRHNSQIRDEFVRKLYDLLHSKRAVLVRQKPLT